MRSIKFRGKSIITGKWLYGSLINNAFYQSNDGSAIPYILDTNKLFDYDCFADIAEQLDHSQVDSLTVGQHTGLKDKNGYGIYEGDIYEKQGNTYLVICDNGFRWQQIYDSWLKRSVFKEEKRSWISKVDCELFMEIIGNRFDNPELLELEVTN